MKTKYEILAPVLLCMGNKLLPSGPNVFDRWKFRLESFSPTTISLSEPIRSMKSGFNWLVDSHGKLIMFHELDRRPKTPEFLKRIVNFTRIHYMIDEPRSITLSELGELVKGKYGRTRDSIAQAKKMHGIDVVLTKEIFMAEVIGEPDPTVDLRYVLKQ